MSPQTKHALGQSAIMAVIGILGIVVQEAAGWGLEPTATLAVVSLAIALVRILEGLKDSRRAEIGLVEQRDVGFRQARSVEAGYLVAKAELADRDEELADAEFQLARSMGVV